MADEKSLLEDLENAGFVEIVAEVEPKPKPIEHIDGQESLIPAEPVWHGAEALRPYLVPIDSLTEHERNSNIGDVFAISRSLEKWGQVRPILHDDGVIVAGHHVRKGAMLLHWTHIAALPNEFESDEARLGYLMADNKIASMAKQDAVQAHGNVLDLETAGYAESAGYSLDDRETLQEQAGLTPTQEARPWEETAGESPEAAAARQAAVAQYEQHREVVLLLTYPEQYELFGQHVRKLMAAYGTTGTVATIARAVGEAAAAVEAREVPE